MANKLATVFILVYNNVSEIDRTIESIIMQDYDNVEVIISDDGSTKYDTSVLYELVEKIKIRYKNAYVNINEKNVGTVKHLNKVFSIAKGDVLITCSCGDMLYDKTSVSRIVEHFDKTDDLIVTARRIDRYDDHDKIRPTRLLGAKLDLCPKSLMNYMVRKKNLISGACTYYRKELFEKYGYHDESYHLVEDYPYYVMLLQNGVHFGFMAKPTMIHTIGGVSTGNIHPSIYKDIELMREKLYTNMDGFDGKTKAFLKKCHEEVYGG